MKTILFLGTLFFILAIVVGLIQLWGAVWSAALFLKIEITLGALFLILLVIWYSQKEYRDARRQQHGDSLD
jgi:hypothetical protein